VVSKTNFYIGICIVMSFYQDTVGFIIHQRDYSNNSLIIEFFSQDLGMVHLIAKGIKKNKQQKSQLHYFSLLKIQYYGKSNLKTLSSLNLLKLKYFDNIVDKTAGLYLNELLHYSLVEFDKAETLFNCYQGSLSKLGKGRLTPILRNFEKELLKHNGFELSINTSIQDDCWIGIDEQMGFSTAQNKSDQLCKNKDLKQFLANQIEDKGAQKRINKFMIHAINLSLNNRRLFARELLMTLTSKNSR